MPLELTTTRRRTPLAETTFVTRVPPYIQTYIGDLGHTGVRQQRLRRAHGRLERGISALDETTFVTRVPPYIQTYIGEMGARMYDEAGRAIGARMYDESGRAIGYIRERELMGFGALDAQARVRDLQSQLRKVGHCEVGRVDNLYGPATYGALVNFASANGFTPGDIEPLTSETRRANTIRIDTGLKAALSRAAAGELDTCTERPARQPDSGPELGPMPNGGGGAVQASVFSNPMLWLGIAAVAAVGYYAYTQSESGDDMLMMPPRL